MYGNIPYGSTPYAASLVAALNARGLVGLSIQELFSVVIASALAPLGSCQVSNKILFNVTLTHSVTQ
jgi:hypothetical protein